jgi:hypothetical protein
MIGLGDDYTYKCLFGVFFEGKDYGLKASVNGRNHSCRRVPMTWHFLPSAALYLLGIRQIRRQRYFFERHTGTTRLAPAFLESDADAQIDEC